MAITCADDLKLVTGENVDDAHPHGDLDRIAYGGSSSASAVRGYPIVCLLEELLWRHGNNWFQKDLVDGSTYSASGPMFSRLVKASILATYKDALDAVTGEDRYVNSYALTAVPPLSPKVVSAVDKVGNLATFRANYASCLCGPLPYLSATLPSRGDRLTATYLDAMKRSLAAFDAIVTTNWTYYDDCSVVTLDEDGEGRSAELGNTFGFFGRRSTGRYGDRYYKIYQGPSASAIFSGFALRDGAPVSAVYAFLFVKADMSNIVNGDLSKSTKYVCYPVAYDASNTIRGSALGVNAIEAIGSSAGFDFSMPEVSTSAENYSKKIILTISGGVAVVQFKAL